MNLLYYGSNEIINDHIIKIYNKNNLNINENNYKNFKYFYNNNFYLFTTINVILLNYIKNIISSYTINNIKRNIIIFNIELMDFDTKISFRNILEKYYNTTFFICSTTKISFIDKPIISRCSIIRVPIDIKNLYNITPASNITIKPTLFEIKKLVKKCKNFKLADIINDLLKITPYKNKFIIYASNIEYQYIFHKNINIAIEALFLICFYPSKNN
jgi:DNA polymerase III delta prime subunit